MKTQAAENGNLGGGAVPAGVYIWEVEEVDYKVNDSGAESYMFKFKVDSVIDGEGRVGSTALMFQNVVKKNGDLNDYADESMQKVITAFGLMDELEEKSKGKDIDLNDPKLITFLKAKAPGCFFEGTHYLEETEKGKNVKFTKIVQVGKTASDDAPAEQSADDADDWNE